MKGPKLDQPTFWLVYACGGYIAVQIFAAGVEWERARVQRAAVEQLDQAVRDIEADVPAEASEPA